MIMAFPLILIFLWLMIWAIGKGIDWLGIIFFALMMISIVAFLIRGNNNAWDGVLRRENYRKKNDEDKPGDTSDKETI